MNNAPALALFSWELRARRDRELAERIASEAIRQPKATVEFVPSGKPRTTVSFGWGR